MIVCDERQKHKRGGKEKKGKMKDMKYECLAEGKTSIIRIHLLGHDMR
jgi:hypothetical protein